MEIFHQWKIAKEFFCLSKRKNVNRKNQYGKNSFDKKRKKRMWNFILEHFYFEEKKLPRGFFRLNKREAVYGKPIRNFYLA